jgi:Uma2 family endonuclease
MPDLVTAPPPSSRRYDRVTKLRWYAQIGVAEYWLVDVEAKTLEQLLLRGQTYEIADSLADGEVFRPATFAGLEIALGRLWAD